MHKRLNICSTAHGAQRGTTDITVGYTVLERFYKDSKLPFISRKRFRLKPKVVQLVQVQVQSTSCFVMAIKSNTGAFRNKFASQNPTCLKNWRLIKKFDCLRGKNIKNTKYVESLAFFFCKNGSTESV